MTYNDDLLDRHDKMQRLNARKTLQQLEDEEHKHEADIAGYCFLICTAIAFLAIGFNMRSCEREPQPARLDCTPCHPNTMKMVEYFKKNGSKSPEEMANAVLLTKTPRLLAAVAVVETGGNHKIRSSGYKRRHHGAFQVNPKHWGKVPYDAAGQALLTEKILVDLLEEKGDIVSALNAYGGDKTHKTYATSILKELTYVPRD